MNYCKISADVTLDVNKLMKMVQSSDGSTGSIVSFVGVTRNDLVAIQDNATHEKENNHSPMEHVEVDGDGNPDELQAPIHPQRSRITALEYHAHHQMSENILQQIQKSAQDMFGLQCVAIEHKLGVVAVGEHSVAVVIASGHRGDGMQALVYVMDQIKLLLPVWKMVSGISRVKAICKYLGI